MGVFLWIGSAVGAVLGLLHGRYLYRQQRARVLASGNTGGRISGLYYALWTFALWTLFGSYVLTLWFVGAVAHWTVRLVSRARAS